MVIMKYIKSELFVPHEVNSYKDSLSNVKWIDITEKSSSKQNKINQYILWYLRFMYTNYHSHPS